MDWEAKEPPREWIEAVDFAIGLLEPLDRQFGRRHAAFQVSQGAIQRRLTARFGFDEWTAHQVAAAALYVIDELRGIPKADPAG